MTCVGYSLSAGAADEAVKLSTAPDATGATHWGQQVSARSRTGARAVPDQHPAAAQNDLDLFAYASEGRCLCVALQVRCERIYLEVA